MMMELISAVRKRLKWTDISSMAKTMPPKGVLKAAANPAAAPATIQADSSVGMRDLRKRRLTARKMDAEIWMVGPSRPRTAPPNPAKSEPAIFTATPLRERSRSTQGRVFSSIRSLAASTWGLPLPEASGARKATRAQEAKRQKGVQIQIKGW